jgi:hypothetical protein
VTLRSGADSNENDDDDDNDDDVTKSVMRISEAQYNSEAAILTLSYEGILLASQSGYSVSGRSIETKTSEYTHTSTHALATCIIRGYNS